MVKKRKKRARRSNGRDELQKALDQRLADEQAQKEKRHSPSLKRTALIACLLIVVQTALCLGIAEYWWQKEYPGKTSPILVALREGSLHVQKELASHWQALTSAVRAKQKGGAAEAAAHHAPKAPPPAPAPKIAERGSDQEELRASLAAILAQKGPDCAVFLLRPRKEREPLLYQSRAMQPASMIKLFVLAYAMQQAKDGTLSLSEPLYINEPNIVGGAGQLTWHDTGKRLTIEQFLERMITDSDNTATNILIDRLGMENIDGYIRQKGYNDTRLQHKMMLSNRGLPNLSSVKDIGTLLARIYRGECVDKEYDRKMLQILARQKDKDCLPSALPTFLVANKTGEITGVYADGGIAQSDAGDMILVVMDDNCLDRQETIALFQQVARKAAASL